MINLTPTDYSILYELDLNSRQTNKQLAKKAKVSEQTVAYRIDKMLKEGVIKKFVLMTNPRRMGYTHYKLYLKLQNISPEKEQEFINYIKKEDNIFWAGKTLGLYDYVISYLAKDLLDYKEMYDKIKEIWGPYVYSEELSLLTHGTLLNRSYLKNSPEKREILYGGIRETVILDEKDKKILHALGNSARLNYIELGKITGITPDTVKNRYDKLKKLGAITGAKITIDEKKIGRTYTLATITLQSFDVRTQKEMQSFATRYPEIIYYINCIGNHNIELEMETKNNEETEQIINDFRKQFFKYIKNYTVLTVKEELKLNFVPF
ncbi:MAG: winged helix-turn-helix transcriptional regulator [Candidatus ainarchaeum sp.]|nr:winged helix-turn-helix transcriptional regulator [Candidatus ainarchaeum sp.]